jgi:hypothetical protein
VPTEFRIVLNSAHIVVVLARHNRKKVWLATQLGITPSYLTNLLKTHNQPSPEMREKIVHVFRVQKWKHRWDDLFRIVNE